MNILVVGATGMIGAEVVSEAATRGHHIMAASRQAPLDQRDNVTPLALDINDAKALKIVAQQADLVISAVSPRNGADPTDEALAFTNSLIGAVEGKRLILVGGAGSLVTDDGTPVINILPDMYRAEAKAMLAAFNRLKQSGVDFTVQAPALEIFPGDKKGGVHIDGQTVVFGADGSSKISTKDFASVLVDEAESPHYRGQIFNAAYA